MTALPPPDDATARQVAAADPGRSVWVSANAGSGKTRVLIDRVARLLLDGTNPAHVLCLTYTKAAAAEMQNRLFARLGHWAMQDDGPLAAALAGLGVAGPFDAARLAAARRLFAQAVEVPGGLRIQTIHAFCAALLRRFPLEAGVSPAFAEMDDRSGILLRAEVLDVLAERGAPQAVAALAAAFRGDDLDRLAQDVAASRTAFAPPLDGAGCRRRLGVPEAETAATILADALGPEGAALVAAVVPVLARGKPTDSKAAAMLAAWLPGAPSLDLLERAFLTQAGTAIKALPTKDTRTALGPLAEPLAALMARVEAARGRRLALAEAGRMAALHGFAAAFLPAYAAAKAARGLLDFDDLILRAHALLTDPAVGPWVLYRLDGAIDHILVDEAQDTAPLQWQVIAALAAEFTAGRGARGEGRTLFVVGDRKQSIYSFQGADLAAFDATAGAFAGRFADAGAPILRQDFLHSFRTGPTLLRLVDATLSAWPDFAGMRHIAHREGMPGRAELLPAFEKLDQGPEPDPYDPVDLPGPDDPAGRCAQAVALRLKAMLDAGTCIPAPEGARRLTPGDILILVRRRSGIFGPLIRACKAAGLPVAGADRLNLGAELAVQDIQAVLSFLALPSDDLSLAAALRSPLFGLTERALYALARHRTGTLWDALEGSAQAAAVAVLSDLRAQADYLRPYDLIQRLLVRHDGRRLLVARLGAEAEDGIDELCAQALAYEAQDIPSLTGFLVWLNAKRIEVRRQPEAAGDRIRIMTVHGAKGLEAPVVVLPDTAALAPRNDALLLPLDDGSIAWSVARDDAQPPQAAALERGAARAAAEAQRLLYVALTRAQSWLIVAAAGDIGKPEKGADASWYRVIAAGMQAAGAAETAGGGLALCDPHWPAPVPVPAERAAAAAVAPAAMSLPPLPPLPPVPAPALVLRPSDLGGAKALPGEAGLPGGAAMAAGTRLHRLLERLPGLPRAGWPAAAQLLAGPEAGPLLAEAQAVIDSPALAEVFDPSALAEVAVAGDWAGRRLQGTIDRLLVLPAAVTAIDFKSNRVVPDRPEAVPEGLLRQMGAYAHLLAQVFPGRPVRTAILWTATRRLMPLPHALVSAALGRAALDLSAAAP
jgi:ATP-dependent helicase/nuclease subunit A